MEPSVSMAEDDDGSDVASKANSANKTQDNFVMIDPDIVKFWCLNTEALLFPQELLEKSPKSRNN